MKDFKKNYLLTPGPTPLPPEVYESLSREIIHHRTPQFRNLFKEVKENLKYLFQTKNPVYIITSSGTGAMETAVANLFSKADKVLVICGGKFGQRWQEICQAYNLRVKSLRVSWGKSLDMKQLQTYLSTYSPKALFTTLCETSTAVTYDIKRISEFTKKYNVLLIVDAISGLGAVEFKMDEWAVDVAVAGSQKGLMLPPGLSFISLSSKAERLLNEASCPRYYFDLRKIKEAWQKDGTPFTPAISLIYALNTSLKLIRRTGLEHILEKNRLLAQALKEAVKALGLKLLTDEKSSSFAVTAIRIPLGIDAEALVKILRDEYGVTIAGGQGKLKGKIIRIAHMGWIGAQEILVGIAYLEKALQRLGYKKNLGKGIKAAEKVLLSLK